MPPAARLTDMHVCPMVTGIVPHVGGPIDAPGEPTVLIAFLPAARVTDMLVCVGPPDMIAMGSPTVMIGGLMAARMGDPTVHGGVIVIGAPTVMIGEVGMGGAASAIGMSMGAAKTSAVASCSQNPSSSSTPASPGALPALPPSSTPPMSAPSAAEQADEQDGNEGATQAQIAASLPPVKKEKDIVCGIKVGSGVLRCQHGRLAAGGLLEVVPDGSAWPLRLLSDTIHGHVDIIGSCGSHPIWEESSILHRRQVGTDLTFPAFPQAIELPVDFIPLVPLWLGYEEPSIYDVSVSSCSGPSYSFTINAYPNAAQKIAISAETLGSKIDPIVDGFKKCLSTLVENPILEVLKGSGQAQSQWKEDDKSNLAFYSWSISAGFNPLVAAGFRVPLGPFALPACLSKFDIQGGIFFEVKGEINLQVDGGRLALGNPDDPDSATHFDVKSENSLMFSIVASVYLGDENDPTLSAEASAGTGVYLNIKGQMESHKPVVKIEEFSVGGLKGKVSFHYGFDIFGIKSGADYEAEAVFMAPYPIVKDYEIPFFEDKDAALADGGAE